MNELSTIEGLPGWEALPAEERLKVRKLHAACREIAAAPNKMAAYKLAAQAMKDAGHPMSWQSVQRKFLAPSLFRASRQQSGSSFSCNRERNSFFS